MKSPQFVPDTNARAEDVNALREDARASSYLLTHEQDTPDLTLQVEAGNIYFGSTLVEYAGGNSPSFTAPTTNPRIDILSINDSGTLVRTAGDEDASPTAPTVPAGEIPIAQVFNRVGQTSITDTDDSSNGYIEKDLRPFIKATKTINVETITADGNYTPTAGTKYIEYILIAGGGGGAGGSGTVGGSLASGSNGSAGEDSTFAGITALKGLGGRADLNTPPTGRTYSSNNNGIGGLGAGGSDRTGTPGSGGEIKTGVIDVEDLTPPEAVVIGGGGSGGSGGGSGASGSSGNSGILIIKEHF